MSFNIAFGVCESTREADVIFNNGTTYSIVNGPKKVQFGATNSIGNPAKAFSAQPGSIIINQATNVFYAKMSSQT